MSVTYVQVYKQLFFPEFLTLLEEKMKEMKDQMKDHGAVDKSLLEQQFCK